MKMLNSRTVLATWLIAGGVWVTGLVGLSATGVCGESVVIANSGDTQHVYTHTGTWMTYQHPSGKYTVTVRSQRPL